MPSRSDGRLRALAILTTIAAVSMGAAIGSGAAFADTSPAPGLPETVSTDPLPTVQIDGIVWSQVIIGNTVYAGGNFASARPAGAAAGVNTVPRSDLLAYNLTTGELITSFAPVLDGEVLSLSASPDGTRLYAAGVFTTVDGQPRNRVAAFDVATGTLIPGFRPSANSGVDVVKATNSTVYIGGNFTAVDGITRTRVAALDASTGAALPFTAAAEGGHVRAVAVSPDAAKIVVGGSFTTLNGSGNPGYGMGALNASTGASMPWNANSKVRDAGADSSIYSLTSDSTGVYGTGYVFGAGGNEEGAFRADWASGDLVWADSCLGDTYSLGLTSTVAYIAGHHHDCSAQNGFPQTSPGWTYQRGLAYAKNGMGNVSIGTKWGGTPAPTMLDWWPDFNTGTVSGANQGPWSVAANDSYVVYGGEFTTVNLVGQQGLVRFAVKSIAPNRDGPRLSSSGYVPNLVSYTAGSVRVNWRANYDRDNASLTYQLIRDGLNSSPVYTVTQTSHAWFDRPSMTYLDKNLAPGSTHTYRLKVTDPWGNVAWGNTASVTVASAGTVSGYAKQVMVDRPASYWRLGESSGTAITDWAGSNNAVAASGVTVGQAGAVTGDTNTAAQFSGVSPNGVASTQTSILPPNVVSVEAWFKTPTAKVGKIVGFGNMPTGSNSTNNFDRDITMNASGQLTFGVRTDKQGVTLQSVTTAASYSNNAWHHVVGTVGAGGVQLYVDGARVGQKTGTTTASWTYPGYWRIGGDTITGSAVRYFSGTIDEVAVYDRELDAATIAKHYDLGRNGGTVNAPPTASFTSSATNRTAAVNGSGSTDADGAIASYSWNWGDGSAPTTGVTQSHTYAKAGTYTVTLTVTDDGGATGTQTGSVTVTDPPPPGSDLAKDSFTRTVSSGLGTAETGGLWTTSPSTSFSVSSGAAQLATSAGGTRTAYLGSVASTDTDVQAKVTLSALPAGASAYASLLARRVGSDDYRTRVTITTGGAVAIQLMHGGTAIGTTTTVSGLTYAAGDSLQVRVQAVGTSPTTVNAKVWKTGTTEPAGWQKTASDTTAALQAAGGPGLGSFLGSAATAPVTVSFDDFMARVPTAVAPAANTAPTAAFTTTTSGLSVTANGNTSTDSDGTITSYAWDFGDGSTGTGVSANHTYGAAGDYTVGLTVTDNGGATNKVTHVVTVTAPPAGNVAPTASFTASAAGLTASVDGSSSTDSDGSITSYAWDFGDGSTGTGVTASHTYAAGGTFTVGLTVTDTGGATNSTTKPVTVTAPAAGVLASDDFNRTVSGGWGTAVAGGSWTLTSASSSSVDGSGKFTATSVPKTAEANLTTVSSSGTDMAVTIAPSAVPQGASVYANLFGRRVGTDFYRMRAVIAAGGGVTLQIQHGTATLGASIATGVTLAAGEKLQVRFQVTGVGTTTLSAKAWKLGQAEPADWQGTRTDTTAAMQASGSIGLGVIINSITNTLPYNVAFDDLVVRSIP